MGDDDNANIVIIFNIVNILILHRSSEVRMMSSMGLALPAEARPSAKQPRLPFLC